MREPDERGAEGERVRSSAFLELIGPLYLGSARDRPTFHAYVGEQHRNTFGGAHGGFISALVDIAAGRGARAVIDDGRAYRTVSMTVDFMAPADVGARLDIAVELDHVGHRTVFVTCRVTTEGRAVARAAIVLAASAGR